jgi:hypothetical protein
MAYYKYTNDLHQDKGDAYDVVHKPGETTPHSGIYRCNSCGVEIVSESGKTFPPTRACSLHHPSGHAPGEVRWKLLVWADHRG